MTTLRNKRVEWDCGTIEIRVEAGSGLVVKIDDSGVHIGAPNGHRDGVDPRFAPLTRARAAAEDEASNSILDLLDRSTQSHPNGMSGAAIEKACWPDHPRRVIRNALSELVQAQVIRTELGPRGAHLHSIIGDGEAPAPTPIDSGLRAAEREIEDLRRKLLEATAQPARVVHSRATR